MKNLKRVCKIGWVAGLVLACTLFSGTVPAKGKPPGGGGGPGPSGKVFYLFGPPPSLCYKVNPDGSGRAVLPEEINGTPSVHTHAGRYWFLQAQLPDDSQKDELFAVRDDASVAVQLTDDPDLEIHTRLWDEAAHWEGDDDSMISFLAVRYDASGGVLEAGVYVAALSYAGGEPSGASAPTLYLAAETVLDEYGDLSVDVNTWDFAPDTVSVVYSGGGLNPGLFVYEPPDTRRILDDPTGECIWSPASGGKIAYTNNVDGLATINPDGSDKRTLIAWHEYIGQGSIHYAPDGANIVFHEFDARGTFHSGQMKPPKITIYRIPAVGGGKTTIVPTDSNGKVVRGWSADE